MNYPLATLELQIAMQDPPERCVACSDADGVHRVCALWGRAWLCDWCRHEVEAGRLAEWWTDQTTVRGQTREPHR